jgi:hypothetical protein
VRLILKFKDRINIDNVWIDFNNHALIKKYLADVNIFDLFEHALDKDIEFKINCYFKEKNIRYASDIEYLIKKEYFYLLTRRLFSKKKFKTTKEGFLHVFDLLEDFLNCDILNK